MPAAELRGGLAEHVVGCDDSGDCGGAVRRGDGRDHDHGRAEAAGGLLGAVHDEPAVHAGACGRGPVRHEGSVCGEPGPADRVAGGDVGLLHGGVRHSGRRRGEPAHQAVRELRGIGAGAAGGRRGHGAGGRRLGPRLHRCEPGQAEDRGRRHQERGVRLHLPAGLGPGRALQCCHRQHEGRRLHLLPRQQVVLPDRSQCRRHLRPAAQSRRPQGRGRRGE